MPPPCATWLEKDLAFSLEPEKKVVAQPSAVTRGAAYFGLCNVKGWEVWLTLDGTLIHRRLTPSRHWYSFTYLGRKSCVSLGQKKRSHKDSNLGRVRIELGTLWSESRDLTTAPTISKLNVKQILTKFKKTDVKHGEKVCWNEPHQKSWNR